MASAVDGPVLAPRTQPTPGGGKLIDVALNRPVIGTAGPRLFPPAVARRRARASGDLASGEYCTNSAESGPRAPIGAGREPAAGACTPVGPASGAFSTGVHSPAAVPR